ncbi:MAG: UvrD-helicase domain-containing protein [Parachlamydiaceae bacterium]|nr:UvrD-helicase domain-containing protein [Parachlamydiaceae bacterium]
MKPFNVLSRNLNLKQHYLLEASAGTGKTFSIQNIVVRLLIESQLEEEPILLHRILVVTFTRAATRDLKNRIRTNIEKALEDLNQWNYKKSISETTSDYLCAIIENGEESIQRARKYLKQALYTFDQAQIFTIHSFCARMLKQFALESDMGFHDFSDEEPLPYTELMGIIRDFFRTEVRIEEYCPAQLDILLKNDPEQRKLIKAIQTGCEFPSFPSFHENFIIFIEKINKLKNELQLSSEKMMEDFLSQVSLYKNYDSKITKAEIIEKVNKFCQLFDKNEWNIQDFENCIDDGLVWTQALNPLLLKAKAKHQLKLFYPELTSLLKLVLEPLIDESRSFPILLLRMASHCRKLLRRYQYEEEKLSPDDILRKMEQSLEKPDFLLKIQSHFQAAIIDEFQDTDPLQWKIFHRLFLSKGHPWNGFLYLVGDPKQSIYSFREADIYTYIEAAKTLGEHSRFSLDVNYRSQTYLIEGLNRIFSIEELPHFIPLPKESSHLLYQHVKSSKPINDPLTVDSQKGAIHFFIADGTAFAKPSLEELEHHIFFPFITQEIIRLKKEKSFKFQQFAVLVRDRHQARRLTEFFDQYKISYLNQRGTNLTDSQALPALTDFLRAILKPYDRGAIGAALGSPLMGLTHEEIKQITNLESVQQYIQKLRLTLFDKGFTYFFQEMLNSSMKEKDMTLIEELLQKDGGEEFVRDLQQISDLIIESQHKEWRSPEGIIPFLDNFYVWEQNDDDRIKRIQDPSKDGVKILTLHVSKGLEFEIVFALGLINRIRVKEDYIPVQKDGKMMLMPLDMSSPEYLSYCEENDAEKMRQLYVALTRAKTQLYIPVALSLHSKSLEWGEASPMDLFLARLGQPPAEYLELYERIKTGSSQYLLKFLESISSKETITYSIHQSINCSSLEENKPQYALNQSSAPIILTEPIWMTSFSTLNRKNGTKLDPIINSIPWDFNHSEKTIHHLPSNRETGLLVHQILEKINFKALGAYREFTQIIPWIQPFIDKTPFESWRHVIGELIFNILKTPLFNFEKKEKFYLAELEPNEIYREMPFIYPFEEKIMIEDIEYKKSLVKGIIDLIFSFQGKYYLLDWKTNWLGENSESYSQSSMHQAMIENQYYLQASIYKEALKRYLQIIDQRPFENCFGGVIYLFARGLKPGFDTGIYFFNI